MKIRKLQLKNIGVFDDETIEFQPCPAEDKAEIHIFTGQNGSGKTTILQALAWYFGNREDDLVIDSVDIYQVKKTNPPFHKKLLLDYYLEVNVEPSGYDNSKEWIKGLKYIEDLGSSKDVLLNLTFAAFAYSGYRRIKDETIEIGKESEVNGLYQALEFIKDENLKFTVNQWLGRNLIDSSLAKGKGKSEEAKEFDEKIKRLEEVINDIIRDEIKDNKIKFEMQSATKLVLIKNNQELDFDVLPDGLKSLISWIGDLLMRLDSLKWENDTSIFDREIILFLDEIEVHLHPAWQRKVLPVVQKLFKNSQIFVSTHSPFVVNSVDDAWVYKLELENGKAKVVDVVKSEDGYSYSYVLEEIFGVKEEFGVGVQTELDEFYRLRNSILANGSNEKDLSEIAKLAGNIAKQSEELNTIIQIELRQINRRKGLKIQV